MPQVEIEIDGKIMKVVCCFRYLGSSLSKDEGLQEVVKLGVGEALKTFGPLKMVSYVRSVSLDVKKELYKRVVVPKVAYGADTWGMRMKERHKLDVMRSDQDGQTEESGSLTQNWSEREGEW